MKRYLARTLPRPEEAITLTLKDQAQMEDYSLAWQYDKEEGLPVPPVWEWRRRVEAYAKAKGFTPTFTVQENSDLSKTIRWSERSH